MMRCLALAILAFTALEVAAGEVDIGAIVEGHILPGYKALAEETADLAERAAMECVPEGPKLIESYHDAFDTWVGVSHLRFGPSEQNERAFALAFWPDPRGSTPKVLSELIRKQDPAVANPDDFAAVSVAARGFYALEFLLFDPQFSNEESSGYHCALIKAVTKDIASNSASILEDWQNGYGALMSNPGNDTYRTQAEASQQLFTALLAGLEFTSQTRLGRPMGTFDRSRPNRVEVRRSERSLRHVWLSLRATGKLARHISANNVRLAAAFETALQRAQKLDDPTFSGVADPEGRLRVEALQQNIDKIRNILAEEVGPSLGIAPGFNSLDGD